MMNSAEHIDQADHREQEERRRPGLRHQHKFHQHGDEQRHREYVIDDRPHAHPHRFQNLEGQEQDSEGKQQV